MTAFVSAGGSAFVIGLGNATGGFITAGTDAGLFVVGDVGGPTTVSAPGYAVAESWGSAGPAPMLIVQGGQGADAWVYGLVNAQVTSASGPASLTTLNSAWTSSVTGTTRPVPLPVRIVYRDSWPRP